MLRCLGFLLALFTGTAFGQVPLHEFTIEGFAQGTTYSVKYYAAKDRSLKPQIATLLAELDASLSLYKPTSLICKFNASATGLRVDHHLKSVVARAVAISKAHKGVFDPTLGSLTRLWGSLANSGGQLPDSGAVHTALRCVGVEKLTLRGNMLTKSEACLQLDLNGIAQGYSVDQVANLLRAQGVQHFLVEIGGEVVAKGGKPDGTGFRVGVEMPSPNGSTGNFRMVAIRDGAMTTSGDLDPVRKLSKTLDPRNGYPVQTSILTVTVFAKDAMTADAYDNMLMGMEVQAGLKLVSTIQDLEAYYVYLDANGKIQEAMTPNFRKMLSN